MTEVNLKSFADQIGITTDKLLEQLQAAGVNGKSLNDSISDEEKKTLLDHLQADKEKTTLVRRNKITLRQRQTSQIRQTSRTGSSHTVQVEVRKHRTFVKRSVLEEEKARQIAQQQEERLQQQADAGLEAVATPEVIAPVETAEEIIAAPVPEAPEIDTEEIAAADELVEIETEDLQPIEAIVEPKVQAEAEIEEAVADSETTVSTDVAATPSEPVAVEPVAATTQEVQQPSDADREKAKLAKEAKKSRRKKQKGAKGKPALDSRDEIHLSGNKRGRNRRGPARKGQSVKTSITGQHGFARPTAPVKYEVAIPETITVAELAQKMSIKATEVIKVLMGLGSMVTINQILDRDTAVIVVEEMGNTAVTVAAADPESLLASGEAKVSEEKPRPPVITVMGHVDHGKTSLLDYIRKTKVASGEAGGITQHVGAYRVSIKQGDMTFLDTPGHEAFSAMRARGAKSTDLVILVVAADDGVKPQTIEAINHARNADVPLVVAINKMDRPEADPDRVKQELSTHDVISEGWGGDILMVEISAKTGQGIDELLEAVLLQTEVLDLMAVEDGPAAGVVVEAKLDKGKGVVATVLVQQGTLHKGDILLAGHESGRVRAMHDEAGRDVKAAGPSTPVEIQGLSGVPVAGDELVVVADDRKAREIALFRQGKFKEVKLARQQKAKLENMFQNIGEGEVATLNLVIKADVQGSVEALTDSLEKLSMDEVQVRVVHGMVGGINESDVNLALTSDAIMIGFNVRADATARRLIEAEDIDIHYYTVIYDVVNEIKDAMTGMLKPELQENVLGRVEVREIFRVPKLGAIAGSFVTEGQVRRNRDVRVLRDNIVIYQGKIDSLRRYKEDVMEVKAGTECGIGIKNFNDLKEGDQLEVFETVEVKKSL